MFDFIHKYNDELTCIELIRKIRFSDGVYCPHCGNAGKIYVTNRGYKCGEKTCLKKFNAKAGTVFENSKTPLMKWFFLIYFIASNKKNISSRQWAKNLGLTQKSAWQMLHYIRRVLIQDEDIKLRGIIEIDEAFVSKGGQMWTRWGGISTRKLPIIGMIERGTRKLIIKEVPNRKRQCIFELIEKYIEPGSTIYTDGAPVYRKLHEKYSHDFVEHHTREYVRGAVHTNNIEGVWRQLKSNIRLAHHSVSQKHLQLYCNELCFKNNTSHLTSEERFIEIITRCCDKKLKSQYNKS